MEMDDVVVMKDKCEVCGQEKILNHWPKKIQTEKIWMICADCELLADAFFVGEQTKGILEEFKQNSAKIMDDFKKTTLKKGKK